MRTALLALTATAALFTLSACGSEASSPSAGSTPTSSATSPHDEMSMGGMDMGADPTTPAADAHAEQTTVEDAQAYAVQLEQVFFTSGYPTDLAGAKAAAARLDLQLSPGNAITTYVYDDHDKEFQLCVQNTSGAWSTYDTRPMTTVKKGGSGGCPR